MLLKIAGVTSLSLLMLMSTTNSRSSESAVVPVSADAAKQKFAELSDQFMKDSLALSPSNASAMGYHKYPDPATGKLIELDAQLDDLSAAGIEKQHQFYAKWRDLFRAETPVTSLDPQDAADWQIISDQISLSLLEFEKIQNYRHNPTVVVELIGNAMFLPLTQEYAAKDVRVGHVLSRIREIPKLLEEVKKYLSDTDPVFVKTAIEENDGNLDLIEHMVKEQITPGSALAAQYDQVAPPAIAALKLFSQWLQDDLVKRPSRNPWRLGKELYDQKFKLVMETDVTPEQLLSESERDMKKVRAEMLEVALPLHKQMYPDHDDHAGLNGIERENKIIGEVLLKISDDHTRRDQLLETIQADLENIKQFIREKKIVSLSQRDNLKVIPTPAFMRGIYSVAGFHSAPPLEPQAEAEYWVTPIDPKMPDEQAESKLREYNNFTLRWLTIHEALPGHYIQAEHLNNIQPERRRLLRSLFANGANVEGWAEYIAQVMMDEGFMDHDPRFRMVMGKIRLRVISNAILDIRMHAMNMTDEQAMELMTTQAFQTKAEAMGKLTRVKLSSTQLPTYWVGTREWLEFRKRYQAGVGNKFDMMKFHDMVLDQGALPVPVVEKLAGKP